MSWVKVDDHVDEHPKMLAAGPVATCLWVFTLAYCNRQRPKTGFIPVAKVRSYSSTIPRVLQVAARLVAVGLWEVAEGGWCIHDYGDYQTTDALSAARAEAGRRGGRRSGEVRAAATQVLHEPVDSADIPLPYDASSPCVQGDDNTLITQDSAKQVASFCSSKSEAKGTGTGRGAFASTFQQEGTPRARAETIDDLGLAAGEFDNALRLSPSSAPNTWFQAVWFRQRQCLVDDRELRDTLGELRGLHREREIRERFLRLCDVRLPAAQHRFHTLRTFRTGFATYGPDFRPEDTHDRRGPQRVRTAGSEDAGKWREEADADDAQRRARGLPGSSGPAEGTRRASGS